VVPPPEAAAELAELAAGLAAGVGVLVVVGPDVVDPPVVAPVEPEPEVPEPEVPELCEAESDDLLPHAPSAPPRPTAPSARAPRRTVRRA
jgi:hypothetical protein